MFIYTSSLSARNTDISIDGILRKCPVHARPEFWQIREGFVVFPLTLQAKIMTSGRNAPDEDLFFVEASTE